MVFCFDSFGLLKMTVAEDYGHFFVLYQFNYVKTTAGEYLNELQRVWLGAIFSLQVSDNFFAGFCGVELFFRRGVCFFEVGGAVSVLQ